MNRLPSALHPSLPTNPQWSAQQQQQQQQQQFMNNLYSAYSSHYAQAYMQPGMQSGMNHLGYSCSSTYAPSASYSPEVSHLQTYNGPTQQSGLFSNPPQRKFVPMGGAWYQPGPSRCTYQSCSFTGSQKSVEIHMMDRHLIYPPGHKKHKGWDADPSLKGKTIPIQGTSVVLDTPESIDAWIEERKRRWPSASKVEEKKRKLEEAIERGQLTPAEAGLRRKKQPRLDHQVNHSEFRGRGRGRGKGRGHGLGNSRGRGRGRGRGVALPLSNQGGVPGLPPKPPTSLVEVDSPSSDDGDSSEPEVISSKIATPQVPEPEPPKPVLVPPRRKPPRKPQEHLQNSFVIRKNLLQQLLLPEVRITISNLSQSIRFLVDNDFLDGVEMRPGEAADRLIDVLRPEMTEEPL